jgi:hypothetical protein
MAKSAEVDRWFRERKPATEKTMQRVRDTILGADDRMTERVQYGTVTFACKDNMASFVQVAAKHVTLMFNRGQLIQQKAQHPHLEGDGPNARFMRFADEKEVTSRAAELRDLTRRWCDLMMGGGVSASSPRSPRARARR